jgi:hypothetical protein
MALRHLNHETSTVARATGDALVRESGIAPVALFPGCAVLLMHASASTTPVEAMPAWSRIGVFRLRSNAWRGISVERHDRLQKHQATHGSTSEEVRDGDKDRPGREQEPGARNEVWNDRQHDAAKQRDHRALLPAIDEEAQTD